MVMYYQASRLSANCGWWAQQDLEQGCLLEQENILVPLKDWMFGGKDRRKGTLGLVLTSYKVLIEVLDKLQEELVALPSPLILNHEKFLKFLKDKEEYDFSKWVRQGVDRCIDLQKGGQFLDLASLQQKIRVSFFQVVQVMNLVWKVN